MVQLLLTKYWVLAHLLVTAGTLCFIPVMSFTGYLWTILSLLMVSLTLPPVLRGESFSLARSRVLHVVLNDAMTYAALLAVLYVGIGLFNAPRALVFEASLKRWVFTDAPLKFCPSAIEAYGGLKFFAGLACGLAMLLVVRGILTRKLRLFALIGVGAVTGLTGTLCVFIGSVRGAIVVPEVVGTPYAMGTLCFLMASVAMGLTLEFFLEGRNARMSWAIAVLFLNLLGCMGAGAVVPRVAILVVSVIYLVVATFATGASGRPPRILWIVILMMPAILGLGFGYGFSAEKILPMEMWSQASQTFWSQWGFRAGLALDVFGDSPMLGLGSDGFVHDAVFFIKGKLAWSLWKSGGTGVPCDFLKLLAEQGLLGTVFILMPGLMIFGRVLARWIVYTQDRKHSYSTRYIFVFCGTLMGWLGVVTLSFFDTPMHSPAVLGIFLMVSASLSGWMPRMR